MDLSYYIFKCLQYFVLSTVVYNVFIAVIKFRVYKFAWGQKARWIPILPFVGNAFIAVLTGHKVNMMGTLLWIKRYTGMPMSFWFGCKYHYITDRAEDAKIVLNHPKCLDKAEIYDNMHCLFGKSLLLMPGEEWKGRRRYFRSVFNTNMINSFIPTFDQQSCALVELMNKTRPEEDYYKMFNIYSFKNFFLTSFGWMAEDVEDSDLITFEHLINQLQNEFVNLFANPLLSCWIWIRSPLGAKFRESHERGMNLLRKFMTRKIEQRLKDTEYVDSTKELKLADLLLVDKQGSESYIYNEFSLFGAAATDTTGHSLTFCFTLLGMFPDIQQKLYEEVMSVVDKKEIDSIALSKLVYTEAVISEALRLLPPIPGIGRYCSEDIDLGDKILPAGASVIVSIYHIHRNPDYWKDPLVFDPDRFLPENLPNIKPGTYLPFSCGPRNCIGQRMATVLMKLTVANVVKNFKSVSNYKSIMDFKLTSCLTMKTRHDLDLRFIPRTHEGQ